MSTVIYTNMKQPKRLHYGILLTTSVACEFVLEILILYEDFELTCIFG